ncbi:MAG: nickel pincer cofactor biosynthesis protein LarC [Longimicrobiales bacterium]
MTYYVVFMQLSKAMVTDMRALVFDPFAGASGDMTLAALLDLGLSETWLREFIAGLGLGEIGVRIERVMRKGISCAHIQFDLPHEHAHRHLRHVVEIIEKSAAPAAAKARAIDAFRRIAIAEAAVHGTTVEKVHFHEVGALDAILDILCTMAAVDEMGFERFYTRPVALGSGWIEIAHGRFPVPAPATLRILEGVPTTGLELDGECTTPTGAALIATLTDGAQPPADLTIRASGFGAGSRDPQDRPNCLRLIAADVALGEASEGGQPLLLIQADIDDMPPEYLAAALDRVIAAGALDAVLVPILMKKGRPAHRLEALVEGDARTSVSDAIFHATSTIGVRFWPVARQVLERTEEVRTWQGQSIRWKAVTLPDGTSRAKPEYEDVAKAAAALGRTPFEVRQALDGHATNS